MSLEERFWAKVDKKGPNECWLWMAYTNKAGYGMIGDGKGSPLRANRASWKIHNGEIPKGLNVLHSCDNPPCCNPRHLFLGTQIENLLDRDKKGRVCRGSRHSNSKLTEEKVRHIRTLKMTRKITNTDLAKMFGVNQPAICQVLKGNTWGHVI